MLLRRMRWIASGLSTRLKDRERLRAVRPAGACRQGIRLVLDGSRVFAQRVVRERADGGAPAPRGGSDVRRLGRLLHRVGVFDFTLQCAWRRTDIRLVRAALLWIVVTWRSGSSCCVCCIVFTSWIGFVHTHSRALDYDISLFCPGLHCSLSITSRSWRLFRVLANQARRGSHARHVRIAHRVRSAAFIRERRSSTAH